MEEFVIAVALYVVPLYLANSCAMLFGGGMPLDLNRKWRDGRPVLGKGKTIRGGIAGIAAGSAGAVAIWAALPWIAGAYFSNYVLLGFLLSAGAIAGDATASFFKRRNNIPQGESVLFLDQLDCVMGGFVLGSVVHVPSFYEIIFICVITLVAHRIANWIAYAARIKKVPW